PTFFFDAPPPPASSTLSLHDALPISLPGRGRRRQLGGHDRPLHAGRDGRREPPAGGSRERGLAADQRDAGGPRLHGLGGGAWRRSEEHTSELQSRGHLVCRLLLEKKK